MWLWLFLALLAVLALAAILLFVLRPPRVPAPVARVQFERQRASLEAQFFQAAATSGKPRGLRWTKCEWNPAVELARDRKSGQLLALVGVTISFEAIEGGDMEGVAAVGNLRNASAVFFFDGGRWSTAGRAVFNLNPDEAIQHFNAQYERVDA
jgi:hypothetical protein